jgi:hypothetical protein
MILLIKETARGGPWSFSQESDMGLNVKLFKRQFNVEKI